MFRIAFVLCLVSMSALADIPVPGPSLPTVKPKSLAVEHFSHALSTDPRLMDRLEELKQRGFIRQGKTEAVLLDVSCGLRGCTHQFLVSAVMGTPLVRVQGTALAAMIEVNPFQRRNPARVMKVLGDEDLKVLMSR